jgi:hypothetical protein
MRARAKEQKAEARAEKNRAAGEGAVLAKIAEMAEPDRAMAGRLHEIVKASAPALWPKTWYGMPAYANEDGKVVCFFQSAEKFGARYATLGFSDEANLDEGAMWPTSFALKELSAAEEAKIGALVKRAAAEPGSRAPLPRSASSRHRAPAHPRRRSLGGQRLGGRCAVPGAAVLRLGRRGAAGGHADGQPDRQEPRRHPAVRLGLGHTRDVSMIDGEVEVIEIDGLPQERGDRFAARTGFAPRAEAAPYRWFRISPRRIQAWREVNELPDRELIRDGRWLA